MRVSTIRQGLRTELDALRRVNIAGCATSISHAATWRCLHSLHGISAGIRIDESSQSACMARRPSRCAPAVSEHTQHTGVLLARAWVLTNNTQQKGRKKPYLQGAATVACPVVLLHNRVSYMAIDDYTIGGPSRIWRTTLHSTVPSSRQGMAQPTPIDTTVLRGGSIYM